MNLTLEERERRAYITNSPDHSLIVAALDAESDALDEMRHERDMAKEEAEHAESEIRTLQEDLEEVESKNETLESEKNELEQRIHDAGVDLVA